MTRLRDIIEVLNEIAPFSLAEDWDNSGLQIGSLSTEIKKMLIALNPTVISVKRAAEKDAQLLLTHHPLIFRPVSCVTTDTYPGDVICESIRRNISIIAMHTNLDAAKTGINQILAEMLELDNIEALQPSKNPENDISGIGRVGDLKSPKRLSEVSETVKRILGLTTIRVMGKRETEIRRIAVAGGSGGSMIVFACEKGADLLITGEIKHHEALAAESAGLCMIDGGHFSTERTPLVTYVDYLRDIFKKKNINVMFELFEDEEDPMRYE